ncbi:MAG: class II glutamine amidotransferase, partial [Candidatus Omnitrophica bacterium]|nr:class II glutamine amidotransferase [Candidatus Omnitrophota bacterium]
MIFPKKQGLFDPQAEYDACGVGFVASIKNHKSHEIVRNGVQILENLSHRGACGCDPETGDGAGILIQMPDAFFRKELAKSEIILPEFGDYGAGMVFLPQDLSDRNILEEWTEHIIHEEGQKF